MFNAGDVVVLRGNQHPLTVKVVSSDKVTVVWFDSNWILHQEQFTSALLEYKDKSSTNDNFRKPSIDQTNKPAKQS